MEVHQNSAIEGIRLANAKLTSGEADWAASEALNVSFRFKSKVVELVQTLMRIEVAFRMTGEAKETGAKVVRVDCVFEGRYGLNPEFAFTKEHAEAFANGNAIFNAWPYFREYLQSSLARMGYPTLVAPFLVMRPKLESGKQKGQMN